MACLAAIILRAMRATMGHKASHGASAPCEASITGLASLPHLCGALGWGNARIGAKNTKAGEALPHMVRPEAGAVSALERPGRAAKHPAARQHAPTGRVKQRTAQAASRNARASGPRCWGHIRTPRARRPVPTVCTACGKSGRQPVARPATRTHEEPRHRGQSVHEAAVRTSRRRYRTFRCPGARPTPDVARKAAMPGQPERPLRRGRAKCKADSWSKRCGLPPAARNDLAVNHTLFLSLASSAVLGVFTYQV